jgi:amidase
VNGKPVPSTDNLFWAGYSRLVYLPSTIGPIGILRSGLPGGYQAVAASGCDRAAIAFGRFVEEDIGGFVPPPRSE